ncbi:MAG: hypothetical protein ACFFCQ_16565 [Promethearchaeota archaeon]
MKTGTTFDYFPELSTGNNYYFLLLLSTLPACFLTGWMMLSYFLIIFLMFEVVLCFHALSDSPGLTINQIPKMIQKERLKFLERSEIMKFSLKRFKRQIKVVPGLLFKINLAFLLCILFGGLSIFWASYGIESNGDSLDLSIVAVYGVLLLCTGLINLLLFLFPQWDFHNQLEIVKGSMIESPQDIFELKKFQFLSIVDKEAKEAKESLVIEIQTLTSIIDDIESLMTWPFDYDQLFSLIGGILIPFILFWVYLFWFP